MDKGLETLSSLTVWSKYAKYKPAAQRRETWDEIVNRYLDMMIEKYPDQSTDILKYSSYIRNKKVLPSMRALQFAGIAAEVNNCRMYNCAYLPIDSIHAFNEAMFLLLGGSGVGYSVQKHHVAKLPAITVPTKSKRFVIGDDIMGWADAIKALMKAFLGGKPLPIFDGRGIRAKGTPLATSGGKAPGYEPLKKCLFEVQQVLERKKNGEHLTPLECHDILCHIANAVLAGGIRRAAMISLFSLDDEDMLVCKSPVTPANIQLIESHPDYKKVNIVLKDGREVAKEMDNWSWEQYLETGEIGWWTTDEQRGRANNSAIILRGSITQDEFKVLWKKIEKSGSGEPGLYWTNDLEWGTNPCCEVALRAFQFCNLCEINASNIESQEDLNMRAEVAAFFGTLQAGFTDFHYLRPIWRKTTEADALVGIGMTGIASGEVLKYDLTEAAKKVEWVNSVIAKALGINPAARQTLVKPSGTTSCVLGTSSGIHGWHEPYYLRTMRFGKTEEIAVYLMENHPELVEEDKLRPDTICVRIPNKSPEGGISRYETAIELLERIKKFSVEWILPGHKDGINTHNVSATVSIDKNREYYQTLGGYWRLNETGYREDGDIVKDEWEVVGDWMWENRDIYNGLSVLPFDNGSYIQAPFEKISKEEYETRLKDLQFLDVTKIIEVDDLVNFGQTAACAGGSCEIV